MEVRLHPFLTSLLHGGEVSFSLQPHHPWECVLYGRLHRTWSVPGDKQMSHFLLPQIKYWWPRTQSVTLPMELSTSHIERHFYIRSSCTQEWFHAVVKYFYLPSNVVDVFKTGNCSSLANFLISKTILRSRMMWNWHCCCPLLAYCISVIVNAVQTAMATWNRHTISPNVTKVTIR